jgi:hypothetical protein
MDGNAPGAATRSMMRCRDYRRPSASVVGRCASCPIPDSPMVTRKKLLFSVRADPDEWIEIFEEMSPRVPPVKAMPPWVPLVGRIFRAFPATHDGFPEPSRTSPEWSLAARRTAGFARTRPELRRGRHGIPEEMGAYLEIRQCQGIAGSPWWVS